MERRDHEVTVGDPLAPADGKRTLGGCGGRWSDVDEVVPKRVRRQVSYVDDHGGCPVREASLEINSDGGNHALDAYAGHCSGNLAVCGR